MRRLFKATGPFFYANDRWDSAAVAQMTEKLSQQTTHAQESVGLVIGSGGLPYILGYLSVSRLYVCDLHASVIKRTLQRTSALLNYTDWDTYNAAIDKTARSKDEKKLLEDEISIARSSGLLTDYRTTLGNAHTTTLLGLHGDIRDTLPLLASQLSDEETTRVTFANLTSAANYAAPRKYKGPSIQLAGMIALGQAIALLPLAEDAVIVDSALAQSEDRLLVPTIYPALEYPGVRP